nr:probable carbohydrate esterase At4g34215 [Ipomoea batatas]
MEPLHCGLDKANLCGVGLGMLFAHELVKRALSLGVIGLVPCAIRGTYITLWLPGTTYDNQKRAFAALKEGGKLRALLWYHGENEAKDGVGSFAVDVPKIFTSIRKDLNLPHLPIVQVALPPDVREAELEEDIELFIGPPPPAVVTEAESTNEAERFEEVL